MDPKKKEQVEQIQRGILSSVNEMWRLFSSVATDADGTVIEKFLEQKENVHVLAFKIGE